MNNETYTPCTKCGRPMAYCKGQCCGKSKGCECREYGPMKAGCIREIKPSCPYQAVIPSITVENKSNLKDLADCFVHVSDINTTFYIDDKHRMMVTWAGPVEYNNYDLDANPLGLRSQFLIDRENDYAAYYNKTGEYQKFNFSEGGEDSVYEITADWGAGEPTAAYNWQVQTPMSFEAVSFFNRPSSANNSFQITKSGISISPADLLAAEDSLIGASFVFNVTMFVPEGNVAAEETMSITAKPTSVTVGPMSTVISGTYMFDVIGLTETPDDMSLPPLRWKLVVSNDGDVMAFTVETLYTLL